MAAAGMWARFLDLAEQKSPPLHVVAPSHSHDWRHGGVAGRSLIFGSVIWLLILVFVLAAGTIGRSPSPPDLAESANSGVNRESREHTRFRPGGMALDRIAAASNERWAVADGCLVADRLDYATSERAELSRLFATLGRSPSGAALLREAAARGVRVCIDRTTDLLAYYFASMNVVGVSWNLSEGGRIIFLAHELAHIPQHPRYSDNRYFPPEDLVLLRRMREAAAEAIATRIAWELRTADFDSAWEEKLVTPYADVAQAFARAVQDRRRGDSGGRARDGTLVMATRAAFDQWFASNWRRDVYDRMTVAHLQRIASDTMGLVPARRAITDRFLVRIGWIRIGRLGGENFLAKSTGRSLTDAYYAGNLSVENARQIERLERQSNHQRLVAERRFTDVAS